MGFGEIAKSKEELIDLVTNYISSSCIMSEKYKKRVDEFFIFKDNNNCQRIYEEIIKMS